MARGELRTALAVMVVALLGAAPATAQTTTDKPEGGVATSQASQAPATVAAPSWKELFTGTIGDFKALPSRDTFMVLGIGGVVAAASYPADRTVTRSLAGTFSLHEPLEPGATIGGAPFQFGAALATYAFGRISGHTSAAVFGADLVRAQAVAQLTTYGIKFAVHRTRPDGSSFGFPSGHAAVTFASATVVQQHFGWKFGIPAYAVASYVAASRLQGNRHYLSDVAFGAALGIAAGRTVTLGHGNRQFSVGPMVTPGGAGVSVVWRHQP